MNKFKTNHEYCKYLMNKYSVVKKNYLTNYIAIDAYSYFVNSGLLSKNFILKGAYNLLLNYGYNRGDVTRDLDFSVHDIEIDKAQVQLIDALTLFKNEIYSFNDFTVQKLTIASGNFSGIRVNFKIVVNGTSMSDLGSIDVAIEEIYNHGITINDSLEYYTLERSLADKYIASIFWGPSNTREKDFIDIYNLYNKLNDNEKFVMYVKELLSLKRVDENKIQAWLANYQNWIYKWNINGLSEILEQINVLVFKNNQ